MSQLIKVLVFIFICVIAYGQGVPSDVVGGVKPNDLQGSRLQNTVLVAKKVVTDRFGNVQYNYVHDSLGVALWEVDSFLCFRILGDTTCVAVNEPTLDFFRSDDSICITYNSITQCVIDNTGGGSSDPDSLYQITTGNPTDTIRLRDGSGYGLDRDRQQLSLNFTDFTEGEFAIPVAFWEITLERGGAPVTIITPYGFGSNVWVDYDDYNGIDSIGCMTVNFVPINVTNYEDTITYAHCWDFPDQIPDTLTYYHTDSSFCIVFNSDTICNPIPWDSIYSDNDTIRLLNGEGFVDLKPYLDNDTVNMYTNDGDIDLVTGTRTVTLKDNSSLVFRSDDSDASMAIFQDIFGDLVRFNVNRIGNIAGFNTASDALSEEVKTEIFAITNTGQSYFIGAYSDDGIQFRNTDHGNYGSIGQVLMKIDDPDVASGSQVGWGDLPVLDSLFVKEDSLCWVWNELESCIVYAFRDSIYAQDDTIRLRDGSGFVDLTPYLDNTDEQTLTIDSTVTDTSKLYTIGITNGNEIQILIERFVAEQDSIYRILDTIYLKNGLGFVVYDTSNINELIEDFYFKDDSICILDAGGERCLDLLPYFDDTDQQDLSDGGRIADIQTINITNGNPVSFSIGDTSNINEIQTLSIDSVGTAGDRVFTLGLSLANMVKWIERDKQGTDSLYLVGNTLRYKNENATGKGVDLSIFKDSLIFSTGLTRTINTITSNISTGMAGSQTIYGGTGANENLTIQGTVHGTKSTSYVNLQPSGGLVGVGNATPTSLLTVGSFNTTNSNIRTGSIEIQPHAMNNGFITENAHFTSGWKYRATGYAGLFYFINGEGQFRFFDTGTAGATLPNSGNNTQFKVNHNGTVAIGGTMTAAVGSHNGASLIAYGTGRIRISGLDTDLAAPSKSGTVRAVTTDNNGDLSFAPIDSSTTNELQRHDTFAIVSNTLYSSLLNDGVPASTVNLTPYLDNTDDQKADTFAINSNILSLSLESDGEAAKTVDLNPYLDNTDEQELILDSLETETEKLYTLGIEDGNEVRILIPKSIDNDTLNERQTVTQDSTIFGSEKIYTQTMSLGGGSWAQHLIDQDSTNELLDTVYTDGMVTTFVEGGDTHRVSAVYNHLLINPQRALNANQNLVFENLAYDIFLLGNRFGTAGDHNYTYNLLVEKTKNYNLNSHIPGAPYPSTAFPYDEYAHKEEYSYVSSGSQVDDSPYNPSLRSVDLDGTDSIVYYNVTGNAVKIKHAGGGTINIKTRNKFGIGYDHDHVLSGVGQVGLPYIGSEIYGWNDSILLGKFDIIITNVSGTSILTEVMSTWDENPHRPALRDFTRTDLDAETLADDWDFSLFDHNINAGLYIIDLDDSTESLDHINTICEKLHSDDWWDERSIIIVADSSQLDTAIMLSQRWNTAVLERDLYDYVGRGDAMFSQVAEFPDYIKRGQYGQHVATMLNDEYTFFNNATIEGDTITINAKIDSLYSDDDSIHIIAGGDTSKVLDRSIYSLSDTIHTQRTVSVDTLVQFVGTGATPTSIVLRSGVGNTAGVDINLGLFTQLQARTTGLALINTSGDDSQVSVESGGVRILVEGDDGGSTDVLRANGSGYVYWGAAPGVTSIATNNGITGGTITSTGTIGLTGQAFALHNLGTNGIIARTGSGTVSARTITAGTGISISNGDGVSGNPTITNTGDLSSTNEIQTISKAGTNSTSLSLSIGGGTLTHALLPTTSTSGHIPVWNGSNWVAQAPSGGSPTGSAGGDLTGTYPNPTIASGAVTSAKMANMPGFSLKGRATGTTGAPSDVLVGSGLIISGGELQLATNYVTGIAVSAKSSGTVPLITTGVTTTVNINTSSDIEPNRPSVGNLNFTILNDAVTNAKLANMSASTVKGRISGSGNGDPSDLTLNSTLSISGAGVLGVPTGGIGPTELASTAVTAGTYTSAGNVISQTVDADGRLTSLSATAKSGASRYKTTGIDVTADGNVLFNSSTYANGTSYSGGVITNTSGSTKTYHISYSIWLQADGGTTVPAGGFYILNAGGSAYLSEIFYVANTAENTLCHFSNSIIVSVANGGTIFIDRQIVTASPDYKEYASITIIEI